MAAILYQRGVATLADAVRISGLSEATFAEAISAVKKLAPGFPLTGPMRGPAIPADFKFSVLMPVYNEARTIKDIIERVRAVTLKKEIIIVDDGSRDGTVDVLKSEVENNVPDVRVFYSA